MDDNLIRRHLTPFVKIELALKKQGILKVLHEEERRKKIKDSTKKRNGDNGEISIDRAYREVKVKKDSK